ncbi:sigma-70 family RNA polymerase sigma factor [Cellulomonas septica]|uniref:RNA polymerase sigma factor n=1 Tax=Cellulomonas septica TaxID=285080 RepID=A0ABX1JYB2_9CELL|nr:RNA polymerase sigma factor [Cellulomonas septica]
MTLGDRTHVDSFEGFFRQHVASVRRFACRSVGDMYADDVVSETFTIVWRKWSDAPAADGVRRAWLFRIAHNVMAHHVRSQVRRGRLLRWAGRMASESHPPDPADRVVGDDHVKRALLALPFREREAMALVVWEDLTPQQAAFALECSVTALSSRLTRARQRLVAGISNLDEQGEEVRS